MKFCFIKELFHQKFNETLTLNEYLSGSSHLSDCDSLQQKLIWSKKESETNPEEKIIFPLVPMEFLLI